MKSMWKAAQAAWPRQASHAVITGISRCIPLALMTFILSCAGGDDITSPSKVEPPALLNQTLPDTTQPWVRTNKDDYIPGEMVLMVGGTFQPGEQIRLTLAENPKLHEDRQYTITADGVGTFRFDGFRPEEHHVGVSFVLTALGLSSGSQAQTTFTDAIVLGSSTTAHNGEPVTPELTLQRPISVVAGQFMIAQVTVEGLGTSDVICGPVSPNGWNLIFRTNNSSALAQAIYWRVATSSEPSSYTWTFRSSLASCGTASNTVSKGAVGGIISYIGVDATSPIFGSAFKTADSLTVGSPTNIANVPAGSRVVRFFGNDKEFQVLTSGGGSAPVYSVGRFQGTTRLKPNGAAADGTQASTGNPTVVIGSNPNSSGTSQGGKWVVQTIALREAAVAQPTISINDVTANEGNSGETDFTFTVTLSSASTSAVSVNFATANGTTNPATGGSAPCTAGTDYQSRSGTINFPIGSTSQQFVIKVCGDLLNELNETFFVNLSNPTNATIADGQGLGTITNDDAAPSISINDVTQVESSPNFAFTVSLSAASSQTVTVNFATANGTTNLATGGASCGAGVDYVTQTGGVVTFNPGETSKPVTIVVCNDAVDEVDETFFVNLSSPTNATITDGQGLGTITDDDASPSLSINDVAQLENSPNFTFTVSLSAASAQQVTVNFATANGTTDPATGGASCVAGVDYVTQNGTVTFNAGETSKPVTVVVCSDAVDEANETFFVNLSNASNATISDGQGLGTITDDDASPSLSINDVTLAEGTGGTTNFTFTVSLSAASEQTVSVDFATANGTSNPATGGAACPGADYVTQNGTRTFVPGDQSETITVVVCADAIDELMIETFVVDLSNASNATISDPQGTGTITDDDAATITINDVTQNEGTGGTTDFTFTVSLSAASSQTVTVNYGTAGPGTATAGACPGADYTTASGTVTFTPSDVSETITVLVCADALDEPNETFFVNLSNPSNATIIDPQGLGTITDDDATPLLSINDVTLAEGTGGTTDFTFTVSLSAASGQTVTVDFATANGTTNPATGGAACPGADYITQNGSRTFTPGDLSETITVSVCPDALDEANETFFVNLSNANNATISDGQGLGTITDDDASPSLSINDVTKLEGTSSSTTPFDFTVSLSAASGQTVTVNYTTANVSATGGAACSGSDYVSESGSVTLNSGETSKVVTIDVCADALDEPDETFNVNLSNASNATITDAQGVGTITDDDLPPDQAGPVTSDVVASPNPVRMNTSFELTAKVDDSNTGNSNIASAEYSLDGGVTWSTAVGTATPPFNTSPTVTVKWTVPGQPTDVYSVCVRGTDAANNTGAPSCILLAVYDPTAGFVTGGGWINSPAGAYPANPTLTGRANFGFVSKYKKGATIPDGSTEFQFQAAGLNFHSTVYEWLVVAGQRAQFKGSGRLNGVDGYGFMLFAIDGTTDKFRIRITNSAGVVVYDNQPTEPENGTEATPLGGGNIVIHRP